MKSRLRYKNEYRYCHSRAHSLVEEAEKIKLVKKFTIGD